MLKQLRGPETFTPREIVIELDKYIVGQKEAKRAVAIALRNRYRRFQLPLPWKNEVMPKNILMIGPTGVGKTEIARRLAHLVKAPFVKVEATKFTEIGYVGRDVESMIRDLLEIAIRMVKNDKIKAVHTKASERATERLVALLVPTKKNRDATNPFAMFLNKNMDDDVKTDNDEVELAISRDKVRKKLLKGLLEDEMLDIEVEDTSSTPDFFSGGGMELLGNQMQDMLQNLLPKKLRKVRLSLKEAREVLIKQEAQKLIDNEQTIKEAIQYTEQLGIVFLDEIDKIVGKHQQNAEVSREGVQRDILPIIEGSTVVTKYGPVNTDHILFIAAGAFHVAKPSELIPELQGRFPIRVNLNDLCASDFVRILTEPKNALLQQYIALLATEDVTITFTDDAIAEIANLAEKVNRNTENIGARRLATLLERLLEELSFAAPDMRGNKIEINTNYVKKQLLSIVSDHDASQYIL